MWRFPGKGTSYKAFFSVCKRKKTHMNAFFCVLFVHVFLSVFSCFYVFFGVFFASKFRGYSIFNNLRYNILTYQRLCFVFFFMQQKLCSIPSHRKKAFFISLISFIAFYNDFLNNKRKKYSTKRPSDRPIHSKAQNVKKRNKRKKFFTEKGISNKRLKNVR